MIRERRLRKACLRATKNAAPMATNERPASTGARGSTPSTSTSASAAPQAAAIPSQGPSNWPRPMTLPFIGGTYEVSRLYAPQAARDLPAPGSTTGRSNG